jgi:MEMO1 family protein
MLKTPVSELSILPDFMVGFSKTSRSPMFAGTLYPADAATLTRQVDDAVNIVTPKKIADVKTMLLPYDDYALVLNQLAQAYCAASSANYDLVVLLSPADAPFNRIAISAYGYLETPLGKLEINDYVRNELCDEDDDFFISEEGLDTPSIELHLPLLQRTLGKHAPFKVLPIVMGNQTVDLCGEVSSALSEIFQSKKVLLIALCNFSLSAQPHLDDYIRSLAAQDYGALLRYAVVQGSVIGTGLGVVAVMARVAHALGAKRFTEFSRNENSDTKKIYLSAAFSK